MSTTLEQRSAQTQAMAHGEAVFGWSCAQAFVEQWEGEQAQPWRFYTTEIPELGEGHHRTNSGQTNWWNLSLKKSGITCRKQKL